MAKSYERSTADRLDEVQMSPEERELFKNQIRSIERTLDFIWKLAGHKSTGRKFRTPAAA